MPEIVNKWDMVRRIPFFIVGGIFLYILVAMVIHAGKMLKKNHLAKRWRFIYNE